MARTKHLIGKGVDHILVAQPFDRPCIPPPWFLAQSPRACDERKGSILITA